MVDVGLIGYTPLNGHPYSFGCIINGFNKNIKINDYPQIESYLRENLHHGNGIDGINCRYIYCEDYNYSKKIASVIGANPINKISDFPKNLDLILVLCDYSSWRTKLIKKLIKNYVLYVDKPLIKDKKDLTFFKNFINNRRIMSSSMFIHQPNIEKITNISDLIKIKVIYSGIWDNYSSHATDPISKVLSSQMSLKFLKNGKKTLKIKDNNLLINFENNKSSKPYFEYIFMYKNNKNISLKIESNFDSFRNGIINFTNAFLSKSLYRSIHEYESSFEMYQLLKDD